MAPKGEELRGNRHFVLEALRLQGAALEYLPDFQDDEAPHPDATLDIL